MKNLKKAERNMEVFRDTSQIINESDELKQKVENSIERTYIRHESRLKGVTYSLKNYWKDAAPSMIPRNVVVKDGTTIDTAIDLWNKREHKDDIVAVLNFASAVNAGGGVLNGSSAQEECICRTTTLYPVLNTDKMWEKYYFPNREESKKTHTTLYNDTVVYTKDIVVLKNDDYELLNDNNRPIIDVITCAAPKLMHEATVDKDKLYTILDKRIEHILRTAEDFGVSYLVLGAFGCGAFRNPPDVVAKAFYHNLFCKTGKNGRPLHESFKEVGFSIRSNSNIEEKNLKKFKEVLVER